MRAAFLQQGARAMPSSPTPSSGLRVQRRCACGGTRQEGEESCPECRRHALQRRQAPDANSFGRAKSSALTIGPSNDGLEAEAESAAERVVAGSRPVTIGGSSADVQRSRTSGEAVAAPASVDRVLSTSGDRLDSALRQDMEQRFGHDFSRVRVHTGADAERSTRELGASAYTVGHDIVFGRNQFAPSEHSGRKLLAHELTHVVQQSAHAGSPALHAQKKDKKKAPLKKPQTCGRDSRKVKDNWITKVNIDVGSNALTIEWNDPKKIPAGSAGTHNISPGAGKCCKDCNDETTSQTTGSLCTPKGGTWKVATTGCQLGGHPGAKNPTYFQRGGIAIHSGNTSSPPQSHGCARTSLSISELIHDNVIRDQTEIASSGTWSGSRCYLTEATDTLSKRADVCDGDQLKPKKKPAKKTMPDRSPAKTPPPQPVAEAQTEDAPLMEAQDADVEGLRGMAADGPGPNNEPVAEEVLGEVPGENDTTEIADDGEMGDDTAYA